MTESVQKSIALLLINHKKFLSVAESCTGGLVSSNLTDVSGSSEYTKINFVTYSNEAKHKYLGVKTETLKKYGAVSEKTAREMVEGLIKNTEADFALSTTGIAGPTGGSEEKPVGLVYIGLAAKDEALAVKYIANSNLSRTQMKEDFAKKALELFYEFLKRKLNEK